VPAIVLLGAQWGDEGKGKATDLLGSRVDYVVRYQGGETTQVTQLLLVTRNLLSTYFLPAF
jgi:adenylosuccinate synthase